MWKEMKAPLEKNEGLALALSVKTLGSNLAHLVEDHLLPL